MEPGPRVEVRRSARRRRTVTAYRDRDTIVVLIPQRMSKADERSFVDDMVQRVLARESRARPPSGDAHLLERAQRLAHDHLRAADGSVPELQRISWVGNQRRRWGSCTPSSASIRLSDRLRPMPAWVVDYVIVHELAHLLEPAHNKTFWALVERYPLAERARGFLDGYEAGRGAPPVEEDDDVDLDVGPADGG